MTLNLREMASRYLSGRQFPNDQRELAQELVRQINEEAAVYKAAARYGTLAQKDTDQATLAAYMIRQLRVAGQTLPPYTAVEEVQKAPLSVAVPHGQLPYVWVYPSGFRAVPYEAVTLRGQLMPASLTALQSPYNGPWALLAPNGWAVDSESGTRPQKYPNLEECRSIIHTFLQHGCSTCGPPWSPPSALVAGGQPATKAAPPPLKDYEHESESGMGDVALMLGWQAPDDDQGFWTHKNCPATDDARLRPRLLAQLRMLLSTVHNMRCALHRQDVYQDWHPCTNDACPVCHPRIAATPQKGE